LFACDKKSKSYKNGRIEYRPHLSMAMEASSAVYPISVKNNNFFSSDEGLMTSCKTHIIDNDQRSSPLTITLNYVNCFSKIIVSTSFHIQTNTSRRRRRINFHVNENKAQLGTGSKHVLINAL